MPEGAVFVKTTDALSVAKDEENVYSHYIMDDREAKTRLHQAIEAGKKRDYRGCISLLLPVVATRNDVADAALYLGRAWHALGEYTPAIAYLRDFHRAKPESVAGMFFLEGPTIVEASLKRPSSSSSGPGRLPHSPPR